MQEWPKKKLKGNALIVQEEERKDFNKTFCVKTAVIYESFGE